MKQAEMRLVYVITNKNHEIMNTIKISGLIIGMKQYIK